jgi:excinuclease ABC subunit C
VAKRAFDDKFGADLLDGLPTGPGVYLFRDADSGVLYVGKAKNIRRRLSNYRNASRKRVHRKMRTLVRESSSLEIRPQPSERQALLEENALIQELRPPYNVDGAYAFLYPALGLSRDGSRTRLCFTTKPEAYETLQLQWFGCFRSRPRARAAFDALVDLLGLVGHLDKRTQLPAHPAVRGSRLVQVRQLPQPLFDALIAFAAGRDPALLTTLATALLDKPRARRDAAHVQACLQLLDGFYPADALRLRLALQAQGRDGTYVAQEQRDALFIDARFDSDAPAPDPDGD